MVPIETDRYHSLHSHSLTWTWKTPVRRATWSSGLFSTSMLVGHSFSTYISFRHGVTKAPNTTSNETR